MENEYHIDHVFDFKLVQEALEGFNINQAFKDQVGISKSYAYKILDLIKAPSEELSSEPDEALSDLRRKLASGFTALSLLLGLVPGLLIRDQSKFSAGMYFQLEPLKNIDELSDSDDFEASAFTWALLFHGLARLNRGLEVRATSAYTSINRDILALNDDLTSEELLTEPLVILDHTNKALERINAIRGKDVDVSFFVTLQYGFDDDEQVNDAHLLVGPIVHKRGDTPNGIELIRRNSFDEIRINKCKGQISKVHREFVKKLRTFSPNDTRAASANIYRKMGFTMPHAFLETLNVMSDDEMRINRLLDADREEQHRIDALLAAQDEEEHCE